MVAGFLVFYQISGFPLLTLAFRGISLIFIFSGFFLLSFPAENVQVHFEVVEVGRGLL